MGAAELKVTFVIGTSIEAAWEESMRLAQMLRVVILFDFNGIKCSAYPNGTVSNGVKSYKSALKTKIGSAYNV